MSLGFLKEKIFPEPNTGCWLWNGPSNAKGYGNLRYKGASVKAHRLSWILHHGVIEGDLFVLHKCDTPACVNVEHLFLGTAKDNAVDRANKNRSFNKKKTVCKNGHKFSGDNLVIRKKDGRRNCRVCRISSLRKWKISHKDSGA